MKRPANFDCAKPLLLANSSARQSDLAHTHRWTDMAKKPEAKPKEAAPKSTGKATGDKGKKGGKK
jgi:hypothetical protein